MSSFASSYRSIFACFGCLLWLVCRSARRLCVAYFSFFKGSGLVLALCLVFLYCFVSVFLTFYPFASFKACWSFCFILSCFFLSFSLAISEEIIINSVGGRVGAGVFRL